MSINFSAFIFGAAPDPNMVTGVSNTDSILMTQSNHFISSFLRIGLTSYPANSQGISNTVIDGSTPGLFSFFPTGALGETTSSVLQFSGVGVMASGLRNISVNQATGSTPGYLSAADWTTFNNKLAPGSTIGQLGNIAANSFLGNNTGSVGPILALTIAQSKSQLGISNNNFGDVTITTPTVASNANGASISASQVLSLTYGDTTNPGLLSATTQGIGGSKLFSQTINALNFSNYQGFSVVAGWTVNIGITAFWSRVGDKLKVHWNGVCTGVPSGATPGLLLELPVVNGVTLLIDTGVWRNASSNNTPVGSVCSVRDAGVLCYLGMPTFLNQHTISIVNMSPSAIVGSSNIVRSGTVTATDPFSMGSGDDFSIDIEVPIVGW